MSRNTDCSRPRERHLRNNSEPRGGQSLTKATDQPNSAESPSGLRWLANTHVPVSRDNEPSLPKKTASSGVSAVSNWTVRRSLKSIRNTKYSITWLITKVKSWQNKETQWHSRILELTHKNLKISIISICKKMVKNIDEKINSPMNLWKV